MTAQLILAQLRDIYLRMIRSNLSAHQIEPRVLTEPDGSTSIGNLPTTALALKRIPYADLYEDLRASKGYHIKCLDGGLLIFQYRFSAIGAIAKHRLAYFPSPELPSMEEAPELYVHDELYSDIRLPHLVRFPIRFDFDPVNHRDVVHPMCHLSLGHFVYCRIPVESPVSPRAFLMFLLRNFYWGAYNHNQNLFEKRMTLASFRTTITTAERRIPHVVMR